MYEFVYVRMVCVVWSMDVLFICVHVCISLSMLGFGISGFASVECV